MSKRGLETNHLKIIEVDGRKTHVKMAHTYGEKPSGPDILKGKRDYLAENSRAGA